MTNEEAIDNGPKSAHVVESADAVKLGRALFIRIKAWCEQRNIKLIVMTTGWHKPHRWQTTKEPTEVFMRDAVEFFDQQGIEFHDISTDVQKHFEGGNKEYTIPRDGHPNQKASKLIAEYSWPILRNLFQSHCEPSHMCVQKNN